MIEPWKISFKIWIILLEAVISFYIVQLLLYTEDQKCIILREMLLHFFDQTLA